MQTVSTGMRSTLMHAHYLRTTGPRMQPRRAGLAEQTDLECAVRASHSGSRMPPMTRKSSDTSDTSDTSTCSAPSELLYRPATVAILANGLPRTTQVYARAGPGARVQGHAYNRAPGRPTGQPTNRPLARTPTRPHAHTHLHDPGYALGSRGSRTSASLPAACRLLPSGRRSSASQSSTGLRERSTYN